MDSINDLDKKKREGISLNPDLVFPDRIYGRAKEQQQFLQSIKAFKEGDSSLIHLIGEPGIGKSFFVQHLIKDVSNFQYHFGKYERFQQGVPYLGIRQLIESIIRKTRAKGDSYFEKWATELRFRFSENYSEFISIVPSAAELWDVEMEVSIDQNSPIALQNRINRFLSNFFRFVISKNDQAIILHLDDLQWCDKASRRFIGLIAEKKLSGLVLILATRTAEISNEKVVDELTSTLATLKEVQQIALVPLDRLEIKGILEELFKGTSSQIPDLLNHVYERSSGNPYALNESLAELSRSGILAFDVSDKIWNWEFTEPTAPKEDWPLSGILRDKLFDLKDEYQKILQIASCFGTNLNIPFISRISGIEQHVLRSTFQQAISLGFLVQSPVSGQHGVPEMSNYEFAHEMAQDSVHSSMSDKERKDIHKKIASYYIEASFIGLTDRDVYDAVYHLNESINEDWTEEGFQTHAEVNLRAAKKAHSTASFSMALTYLKEVLKFDRQNDWKYRYAFAAQTHIFGYEIARLNDDRDLAKGLYKNAKQYLEPLELAKLRLKKCMMDIQFGELNAAIETGAKALKDLGIKVSTRAGKLSVAKEFLRTKIALRGKSPDFILDLPRMKNPKAETAFEIIFWMFRAAQSSNPELNGVLALKELQLTLKHGTNGEAYSGLMAYGVIIGAGTNNYKTAYEYCEIGSKIAEKYKNTTGGIEFGRAIASAYKYPLRDTLKRYEKSKKLSYDRGDFLAAAEPTVNESLTFYAVGMPLNGVQLKIQENADFCKSLHMTDFHEFQIALLYHVKLIKGDVLLPAEKIELDRILQKTEYNITLAACSILSMQYFSLKGEWQKVVEIAKKNKKQMQYVSGLFCQTEFYFYQAAALLKCYPDASFTKRMEISRTVKSTLKKMRKWAEAAPENHSNRLKIIEGLLAATQKDYPNAEQLLKEASANAQKYNFTQNVALANWFLFDLYADQGNTAKAHAAFAATLDNFRVWGTRLVG